MNEFRYIFSWMLIVVGLAIGWYMSFPQSKDLKDQSLKQEAKYSKYIGYTYIVGSIIAIIAYKV
ncbi:MAG: hypothetical protein GX366_00340 [Epulopiscium sp.]|nr:hypothetical protein [Candidatus Epulonipiscium sp.]